MSVKIDRINSELQKQISLIIAEQVKDPRMGSAIVGVTKVYTTPDLKYAKVYVSVYASSEEEAKSAFDTVCRSKAFIRNCLKETMKIRLIPELNFILDDSVDFGLKIEAIIKQIHQNDSDGK